MLEVLRVNDVSGKDCLLEVDVCIFRVLASNLSVSLTVLPKRKSVRTRVNFVWYLIQDWRMVDRRFTFSGSDWMMIRSWTSNNVSKHDKSTRDEYGKVG